MTSLTRGLAALVLLGLIVPALGRDDGRYAQSPYKQWFDSLRSRTGVPCCSDADGIKLDDPEWDCGIATVDRCRVKIDGEWRDVPPEAVIEGPNRVGYAMVWAMYNPSIGRRVILCFMKGSEI
jgi:hypothetical protein